MEAAGFIRRLRLSGLVAVATIALVTVAEAALLSYRFTTAPVRTQVVANSAARHSDVIDVLYRGQKPSSEQGWAVSLTRAIDELAQQQRVMDDLTGADAKLYANFIDAARRLALHPGEPTLRDRVDALGTSLATVLDKKTSDYVLTGGALRERVRDLEMGAAAITLLVVGLLYLFVLRPAELVVARSITELEERRQRFAAMFDNSLELMVVYDREGNILRANKAALSLLKFGSEALGRHYDIHVASTELAVVSRAFAQCLQGEATEFETVLVDAEGREIPALANLSPIAVNGVVVGVVGAARDMTVERQTEMDLLRGRERFRSIFEQSPSAVLGISPDGIITEANVGAEKLTGYGGEELVGKPVSMLAPLDRRETVGGRIAPALSGTAKTYETSVLRKDGTELIVIADISPIRFGERIEGLFAVLKDVTKERLLERRVLQQQDRVRALYLAATSPQDNPGEQIAAALSLGALACDMPYAFVSEIVDGQMTIRYRVGPEGLFPVGHTTTMSHAIGGRLLGSRRVLAVEDLTVEPWAAEMAERGLPWKSYIGTPLFVHGASYGVLALIDIDVRKRPFEQSDFEFMDIMGSMVGTALSRERRETALQERAFHDSLTGAANRSLLEEHLHNAIARAARSGERLAIYYIDLDAFKPVNDAYGHAAGDIVLSEIARRLNLAVREYDLVARVGGDEFVVLQTAITDAAALDAMAARLRRVTDEPVELFGGKTAKVGASFGVSVYPDDGTSAEALLAFADRLMYREREAAKREASRERA